MLGGVSRMHKQNFVKQTRDWPTTTEEEWRSNDNLHTTGRPSTTPNDQNELLHLGSSSANADFGGGCQFDTFGDGFWPPDIILDVQPDVLGSLNSTGDAGMSGGGSTECGTSDNGDTVSSVMSHGSPYTTVTVGSECAVGKGRGWLMPASSLMMEIVARQSWYTMQSTMGAGVSWSWWMEPWTGISTSRSCGIKCCHGWRGCLDITPRPVHNAPSHTAHDMTAFLDQLDVEVMDWPVRSPDMKPLLVWIRDMDDPPSTVAELNNAVHQAWAAVQPGRVRTLVESMPRRVRALLAASGGHTRY